jgi:hypothetical protein
VMRFVNYLGIAATALALTASAAAKDNEAGSAAQASPVLANLETNLDAKTAKVGDAVNARLIQNVRVAGLELRLDTLLVGHVDQVSPSEEKGASRIVLTFDKAQPKNGQPVSIKSTIVGIYPNGTPISPMEIVPGLKVEQEASGVHGYSLNSDTESNDSGVLSAKSKNVQVGYGTDLEFAVAPATAGAAASGN